MPINSMSYNTYSFSEITFVLQHPSLGQFQLVGETVGTISFARAQDSSSHQVAHDGSVMTSKIVTRHGTMSFTAHQDSALHRWLQNAYNYLMNAYADPDWAEFSGRCESNTTREVTTFSHASIQKFPDVNYQQQGQDVTWNFLCGVIDTEHA